MIQNVLKKSYSLKSNVSKKIKPKKKKRANLYIIPKAQIDLDQSLYNLFTRYDKRMQEIDPDNFKPDSSESDDSEVETSIENKTISAEPI